MLSAKGKASTRRKGERREKEDEEGQRDEFVTWVDFVEGRLGMWFNVRLLIFSYVNEGLRRGYSKAKTIKCRNLEKYL